MLKWHVFVHYFTLYMSMSLYLNLVSYTLNYREQAGDYQRGGGKDGLNR